MKPRGERFVWLDHVRDQMRAGTLSPNAGHLALVLAVHYCNGSSEAWPSHRELASSTRLSRRTIGEALRELERNGLLNVRRGHPARTSGNVYTLRNEA